MIDYSKNKQNEEEPMKKNMLNLCVTGILCGAALHTTTANATCADILSAAGGRAGLVNAAKTAQGASLGGYGLNLWATFVDETGKICQVVTSGKTGSKAGNSEWLGSRVISAQKANTANAFSLDGYAISTANLYSAVRDGSLFGLQFSNPVDSSTAYLGNPNLYGTANDPLVGRRIGGVNVFGGGLALYSNGKKIGAIGVSGDTSCRDHGNAWNIRGALGLHPGGTGITTVNLNVDGTKATILTGAAKGDELVLSNHPGDPSFGGGYWNLWAQPYCPGSNAAGVATAANGFLKAE